jgi:hypothetical protein
MVTHDPQVERQADRVGRSSDGMNRLRILLQLLAEAVLVSLFGGIAGLLTGLLQGTLLDMATGFP